MKFLKEKDSPNTFLSFFYSLPLYLIQSKMNNLGLAVLCYHISGNSDIIFLEARSMPLTVRKPPNALSNHE